MAKQEKTTQETTTKTQQAEEAANNAKTGRMRGRLSLLSNEVGILLPAGPGDLQRRLGA